MDPAATTQFIFLMILSICCMVWLSHSLFNIQRTAVFTLKCRTYETTARVRMSSAVCIQFVKVLCGPTFRGGESIVYGGFKIAPSSFHKRNLPTREHGNFMT